MIFSSNIKLAIRAVSFLSNHSARGTKFSLKEIAGETGMNVHSLGKIMQALSKCNVVSSSKGPGGGFFLNPVQLNLPLLIIIEALEGKENLRNCVLGFKRCSAANPCAMHFDYLSAKNLIETKLLNKKISALKEPEFEMKAKNYSKN